MNLYFRPNYITETLLYSELGLLVLITRHSKFLVIYYWGETLKIRCVLSFLLFMWK